MNGCVACSRSLTGTDGCDVICSTPGGTYKAVMTHRENGEDSFFKPMRA